MKICFFFPRLLVALLTAMMATSAVALTNADIGFQQVVDELSDLPDTDPGDGRCKTSAGGCSLRAAIEESNADSDRIWEIQLTGGVIAITDKKNEYEIKSSVIITGAPNDTSILEGNAFSRVFKVVRDVAHPVELMLRNLTLRKGPINNEGALGDDNGSQIFSRGDLTLDNVTIVNGGVNSNAVFVDGRTLTVTNSRFIGNGRAISLLNGRAIIRDSRFEKNEMRSGGAALLSDHGIVEISGSEFVSNTSDSKHVTRGFGGAIQQLAGLLSIRSSRFSGNHCVLGGAIYATGTLLVAEDVVFSANSAGRAGFQNPESAPVGDGGALYLAGGNAIVDGPRLTGNSAEHAGGAIYVAGEANADLRNLFISGNTAGLLGGGVYLAATSGSTAIRQSAILRNSVLDDKDGRGGGVYMAGGNRLIADLLARNVALKGGGVGASGNGNRVENSTIAVNQSFEFKPDGKHLLGPGGGVFFDSDQDSDVLTLTHVTIAGNSSAPDKAAAVVAGQGRIEVKNAVLVQTLDNNVLCAGTIQSGGNNIASDSSCGLTASGDVENATGEFVLDLADNGGPTFTAALPANSQALNHVPSTDCLLVDQRGFKRETADGFCDAGAFEHDAAPLQGGILNFSVVNFLRGESAGEVSLSVERTGGNEGEASVDVVDLGGGDAAPGFDYRMSTQTLHWDDGESGTRSFTVTILDDINKETPANETVTLGLLNLEGAAVRGDRGRANLVIADNDSVAYGEFRLNEPRFSVVEKVRDDMPNNQGSTNNSDKKPKNNTLDIEIQRVGASDRAATVGYRTVDITATAGKDYQALDHSVTFQPGETTKTVTIEILDDDLFEPEETLRFELTDSGLSATPVFFTNPARATITIISDDAKKPDPIPPVRDRTRPATGSLNLFVLLILGVIAGFRRRRVHTVIKALIHSNIHARRY